MHNSYKEMKLFIEKLNNKPSLLLHSCCAPCSSHVLLFLREYFKITVFFSNDNISPYEEYTKRLEEEINFCNKLGDINVIIDDYSNEDFKSCISGLESMGERSPRCYECYKLRMRKTAKKAKDLGFDYFTTALSISPYKNSKWINEIGNLLEKEYNVNFLYSDFKKEEGYKHSIELSKEYNLYRQLYCGCEYSLKERKAILDEKGKED